MKDISHPNVIKLVGVNSGALTMCIITEHMSRGNLHDYLRGPHGRNIESDGLLDVVRQVGAAMTYLEAKKIIHR